MRVDRARKVTPVSVEQGNLAVREGPETFYGWLTSFGIGAFHEAEGGFVKCPSDRIKDDARSRRIDRQDLLDLDD
jgi:hypothetical protein